MTEQFLSGAITESPRTINTNIKALQNSHRGAYGQAAVRHAATERKQEAGTVIIIAKMSTQTINRTL